MIILVGLLLFILLGAMAVIARRRGLSGWETALLIVVGAVCIIILVFGILAWGFSGFG